jgi:hypothetical protein
MATHVSNASVAYPGCVVKCSVLCLSPVSLWKPCQATNDTRALDTFWTMPTHHYAPTINCSSFALTYADMWKLAVVIYEWMVNLPQWMDASEKFDVQQQHDLSSAIFRGCSNWFSLKLGPQQYSSGFRLLKGYVGIFC